MTKLLQKSPEGVPHIISINKDCQRCEIDEDSNIEQSIKISDLSQFKELKKSL